MPASLAPGTIVERYRIEQAIGSGSMGEVFRGEDVDLKRKVALKILSSRHRDNHELRQRFVREGRAVAAISHPNVVQVFTTGTFDGRPYIAMEFLDGTDLGSSVEQRGPWPSLDAARAVRDAALGLRAAARAGLIHRDVKPSNLVLLRDGTVKVTDFGLAKPVDAGNDPALTNAGMVVGTPDYIAPEQARGELIDERVDLYALGGTLYFLLTGVPPFRTGNAAEDNYMKVVGRHLRKPPPDARERVPSVDHELGHLAQLMMAKQPGQRPSYDELIEGLGVLIARLEAGGSAPMPVLALQGRSMGGQGAPAPLVAGTAAPAGLGPGYGAPAALGPGPAAAAGAAVPGAGNAVVGQSSLPRWIWVPTVFAVLIFLTGLLLKLAGPLPKPAAQVPSQAEAPSGTSAAANGLPAAANGTPATASSAPTTASSAPTTASGAPTKPLPTPPEGMLLVTRADGSPWLFVDARPVSFDAYRAEVPAHPQPAAQRAGAAPVTGVGYNAATAYAAMRDRRLLTAEEWEAAAKTPGFVPAEGLWEWVIGEWQPGRAPVRSRQGADARDPAGTDDTTFRLAASLP